MTLGARPISNNSLTAMKLIGIAAMLVDHFNTFINPDYSRTLFEIGRIALPLFAFVLGYNLARIPPSKMPRIALRLLIFGILATPVYNVLGAGLQHWWPLNILFTLCLATAIVCLLSVAVSSSWAVPARLSAILLFAAAGCVVDYFWVGPALVIVIWRLFSGVSTAENTILHMALLVLAGLLCLMNDSLATLFAVPIIYLSIVAFKNIKLPRMKWFFYWFYPGHLVLLFFAKVAFY